MRIGTAIAAVTLTGLSAFGTATAQAAVPVDTDVFDCLDGGGIPDHPVSGGVLTPVVGDVCKGGTHDGQAIG